jgi:hypothetical protein
MRGRSRTIEIGPTIWVQDTLTRALVKEGFWQPGTNLKSMAVHDHA